MKLNNRVNEVTTNRSGSVMKIVEYINCDNIVVEFENGHRTNARYKQFSDRTLKSPFDKTVYGIGYLGDLNNIDTKIYNVWKKIIQRCYVAEFQNNNLSYVGCSICEEWFNFNVFEKWYASHYYKIGNENMEIDKDILIKGNKIYSSSTCVITPSSINCLFIKSNQARGNYPIGVYYKKKDKKFVAQCNKTINGNRQNIFLGSYSNEIDAFYAYKKFKENLIKETADRFKDLIPYKLYVAMYKYEVEITD